MATKPLCSIPGCGKPAPTNRKGWCSDHYGRWWRNGDPLAGRASRGEVQRYYTEVVLTYDGAECLMWPFARLEGGYARMKGGNVHRLVCDETHGPAPTPQHEAAHSCGNGKLGCVAKAHLSWKTPKQNADDKALHGTNLRGETHPGARLTEDQIAHIIASDEAGVALALKYGVSSAHITNIRKGARWGWLLPSEQAPDSA